MVSNITFDDAIRRTQDLPTVMSVAMMVLGETSKPLCTVGSVAEKLELEPALASRVLRLANSPYYSGSRPSAKLSDAIMNLGMLNVRNLCMVAATYTWLNVDYERCHHDPKAIWRHSLGMACGAKLLARHTGTANTEDAFMAGLMADIGKMALNLLLLGRRLPRQFGDRSDLTFDEIEQGVYGFTHAEIGAHLATKWNFPQPICEAIRYHHSRSDGVPSSPMADLVHLADALVSMVCLGFDIDSLRHAFDEGVIHRLGLSACDLEQLLSRIHVEYLQLVSSVEEITRAGAL